MSSQNLDKRAAKIAARNTVAQNLAADAYVTRAMLRLFANMGLFARLGWLFFGRLPQVSNRAPANLAVRTEE